MGKYERHYQDDSTSGVAGGGGGAPDNASYVTLGNNASLSAERVLTAGSGISIVDGGANTTVTVAFLINSLTADTTPLAADVFVFFDAVDATHKKVTWTNLKAQLTADGFGDVVGTPPSAINAVAVFTDTSGLLIKDSEVKIDFVNVIIPTNNLLVSAGSIGIGVALPQTGLHFSAAAPIIRLSDTSAGSDLAVGAFIEIYRGDNTNRVAFMGMESSSSDVLAIATDYAAGKIILRTGNGVERLSISSTGVVTLTGNIVVNGTGTSSFAGDITVAGDATVTGDVVGGSLVINAGAGALYTIAQFSTTLLILTDNTAAVDFFFEIKTADNDGTDDVRLRIRGSSTTVIDFGWTSPDYKIGWTDGADLLFGGISTAMRIEDNASGNGVRMVSSLVIGTVAAAIVASTVLELRSTTGAFLLPRMTTTQRNLLTELDGMMIFNTTTGVIEGREGAAWVNL